MGRLIGSMATLGFIVALAGCGGAPMGQVNGKIVYKGKPVTAGSVLFAPKAANNQLEAGRPASGAPDDRGEFQLSSHQKNDGALIGPHVVSYLAPGPPQTVDKDLAAKLKEQYDKFGKLRLPPGHVVEIKPGTNDITLELEEIP